MIFGVGNRARVEARLRVLGRPAHPVLVLFPLVLFVTGTVFDLARFIDGNRTAGQVGFWIVSAGIVTAAIAAVTGFADWSRIPAGARARRIGVRHGALNGFILLVFVVAWLVRVGNERHTAGPASFSLQVFAVGILAASAWLGGKLIGSLSNDAATDVNPEEPKRGVEGRLDDRRARAVAGRGGTPIG